MDDLRPDFSEKPYENYTGDAFEILPRLQTKVDCVVTSPPYFNQRTYGDDGRELGREALVEEFVASLVKVFKLIPAEPWTNYWVNIGDKRQDKALLGVPQRFMLAMIAAGFYLMDNVVWAKEVINVKGASIGGCMREPAPGRLNSNAWEPILRFVKSPKLMYSDPEAVSVPRKPENFLDSRKIPIDQERYRPKQLMECATSLQGRRLVNVWAVSVPSDGDGHFATYPTALVERCVAMGCPEWITEKGPKRRIIKRTEYDEGKTSGQRIWGQYTQTAEELAKKSGRQDSGKHYIARYPKTVGWTHDDLSVLRKGIVLDPFGGTGTTGEVAIKLGRNFIGIDLYAEFVQRMETRCAEAFKTYRKFAW